MQQDIAELDQCDVGGHGQDRGEQDEGLTDPQPGAHGGTEAGDGCLPLARALNVALRGRLSCVVRRCRAG